MLKLLSILFVFLSSFATPPNFNSSYNFELLKDEWARVVIREKANNKTDVFDFRWTLFDTTNITIQSFFRRFPRHMTMSLRHGQDRYFQSVIPDFNVPTNDKVRLYLTFVGFKDNMASFRVDILDNERRVDVSFMAPVRKNRDKNG